MLRRHRKEATLFWGTFVTLCLLSAACLAGADHGWGSGAAHGSLWWQDSHGVSRASGLYVLEYSPYGVVRRVLAGDSNDAWQAVATWTLDGSTGRETQDLVDDRSGWSARGELRFGAEGESLGDFFDRAHDEISDDSRMELRLSTHKGVEEVMWISAMEPDLWAAFSRDLSSDQADRIAHSIPADFRPAVVFLDECMTNWLAEEGRDVAEDRGPTDLFRVLAEMLRRTFPETETWISQSDGCRLEKGRNHRGRGIFESEILDLTSRFKTVENADPLAGHHVEEVTGPGARNGEDQ
ncbi:MAG: hypothetical protein AAF604_06735 [Acidobacteriota bacterium]